MDSEAYLGGNSSGLISPLAETKLTLTGSNDELRMTNDEWPFNIQNSTFNILSPATVGGSLTVGLLTIGDMDASINSMGETLKLQNLGLADIEFMGGKITIDTAGNLKVGGDVNVSGDVNAAGDITSQGTVAGTKIEILEQPENTATDSAKPSTASIGKAVIPAGASKITIYSTAAGTNSKVFVTADQPAAIGARVDGKGRFTIELGQPGATELKVNWWVVN
mgnify:CR=1 FL=1